MASIFDLKTSTAELSSSNAGTSRMLYEQQPPTRDVTGANFPNGAIHTRFQVSGSKWWVPARSYIRMRCSLTKPAGTPLEESSGVGINMGAMSNLFQSGEFRIADKTVSRVSDYMAQVDALDTRLNKAKAWLDSVGASTNSWEPSVNDRIQKVSSDGTEIKKSPTLTTTTRLAMGFDPLNTVQYIQAGGVPDRKLVFAAGGGAAPGVDTKFAVGDFIVFPALNAASANQLMKITVVAALYLGLEADIPGGNVAAGTFDFSRVRPASSSRQVSTFELTWQPPMSIFKVGHALPSGKYELVLNPQTSGSYKKRIIESIGTDLSGGSDAANDFDFNVVDMYFYVATVDGLRADDLTYLIDLEETRCQVDSATASTGLQQKNFDVSPSSYALTCAFQDDSVGSNSLYSSSKLKVRGNGDLSLTRLYLNYAGQNKPAPDADPLFVSPTDYTTQRYMESILHSGSFFDAGGSETLEEWQERGPYYYFSWPRDGTDRSTRVNANFALSSPANARVLIFDHYKAVARVVVKDGRVVDVQLDDA